jgi:Domain of unknown function (DUF5615)
MNVLDENVPQSQRVLLRTKRFGVRQIGEDVGRKGMQDDELIPLLHQLDRPTFFTLDGDFYDRRLCHETYCLVHLDIGEQMVAEYIVRLLRHRQLNTRAKRMGRVIRLASTGLAFWRLRQEQEQRLAWR